MALKPENSSPVRNPTSSTTKKAKSGPKQVADKAKPKNTSRASKLPPGSASKAGSERKPTTAKPSTGTAAGKPKTARADATVTASKLIDQRIRELSDWRGETLARMRALILEADPAAIEEVKWGGTPVWSHDGIICTGETYKSVVKLTFARGASVADPARLFNSSLEGNTRRAIDIREGEQVDAKAFKALIKAAVAQNGLKPSKARVKPAQ